MRVCSCCAILWIVFRPFISIYTNLSMIQYLARAVPILLPRHLVLLYSLDDQRHSSTICVYLHGEGYAVRLPNTQSLLRSRDQEYRYVDVVPRRLDFASFTSSPRARAHACGHNSLFSGSRSKLSTCGLSHQLQMVAHAQAPGCNLLLTPAPMIVPAGLDWMIVSSTTKLLPSTCCPRGPSLAPPCRVTFIYNTEIVATL